MIRGFSKTERAGFAVTAAIAAFIVLTSAIDTGARIKEDSIDSDSAAGLIIAEYPDLARFRMQTFPPASIEKARTDNGWNIAFIESGSGIPSILTAQCFHVSDSGDVVALGSFKKAGSEMIQKISLDTCLPE